MTPEPRSDPRPVAADTDSSRPVVAASVTDEVDTARASGSRRLAIRIVTITSAVLWGVGTVLHLTVADASPFLAPVWYALPVPVLLVCGATVVAANRQHRRYLAWGVALLAVQAGFWLQRAVHWRAESVPNESLTILLWNMGRGSWGMDGVVEYINNSDADMVALIETGDAAAEKDFWRKHCPGWTPVPVKAGMALLVRGTARRTLMYNSNFCRMRMLDVSCRGQELQVMLVDIDANPLLPREASFEQVTKLARKATRPLIIAGDFNTPEDSVYCQRLEILAQNAFEAAGNGYRETWPVVCPVLGLDHLRGSTDIHWHHCERGWSMHSDHRPVHGTFSIKR